jgi:hypothetical protein
MTTYHPTRPDPDTFAPIADGLQGVKLAEIMAAAPQYSFACDATGVAIELSHEHVELRWCGQEEADALLRYDSNRSALWELAQ